MTKVDTRFKLDESKPLNPVLLKLIKEYGNGSVTEFAKFVGIQKTIISRALNNKPISLPAMIKISRQFGKDSREIF